MQRVAPNLPVKSFFLLLLLLLVSFYFILKADVCSYLLHYRKFQIPEYWFTTSIITWQIQPLLSESWSITGISNFHKSQHINPKVKSFIHRKQFSKISKYFFIKEKERIRRKTPPIKVTSYLSIRLCVEIWWGLLFSLFLLYLSPTPQV